MKSVNNELYDMLIGMTKVEIDFYRKILRCNASSNLKKVDMAAKVVECIENDSEHWLVQFPMWKLLRIVWFGIAYPKQCVHRLKSDTIL